MSSDSTELCISRGWRPSAWAGQPLRASSIPRGKGAMTAHHRPPPRVSSNAGFLTSCLLCRGSPDLFPDTWSAGLLWVSPDLLPSVCSSLSNGDPRQLWADRRVVPPACCSRGARHPALEPPKSTARFRVLCPPGFASGPVEVSSSERVRGHPAPPGSDPPALVPGACAARMGPWGGGAGRGHCPRLCQA